MNRSTEIGLRFYLAERDIEVLLDKNGHSATADSYDNPLSSVPLLHLNQLDLDTGIRGKTLT
jgi:hypothetical protein